MISTALLTSLLGASVSGAEDIARLESLERGAHALFERLTGRTFREVDTLTEFYNGNEESRLELRCPVDSGTPVVSIHSGAWGAPLASDQFEVQTHPRLGIRNVLKLHGYVWPYGEGNIRVVYEGGYDVDAEPEDVRDFVGELTRQRFNGRKPAASASVSTAEDAGLSADLLAVVERWRQPLGLIAYPLLRVG